jgi:hypothetical protein
MRLEKSGQVLELPGVGKGKLNDPCQFKDTN